MCSDRNQGLQFCAEIPEHSTALQEWPSCLLGAALEAGAHVICDEQPSHAMYWASLREFYRVRSFEGYQLNACACSDAGR